MFGRKKKTVDTNGEEAAPKKKRHIIRRIFKYLCLFLILVILGAVGGAWWALQTTSGHAWLVKTANSVLDKGEGLRFRITDLSGSLPVKFSAGIEGFDAHGQWLSAPEIDFAWNWRALPGALEIDTLVLRNVDISRFPDILPSPEPPAPTEPMTMENVRALVAQVANFLGKPPSWMPAVRLQGVALENLALPPGLIAGSGDARLDCDADLAFSLISGKMDLLVNLGVKGFGNEVVKLPGMDFKSARASLEGAIRPASGEGGIDSSFKLKTTIDGSSLAVKDIPPDFIGSSPTLELGLKASALLPENDLKLGVWLEGPSLDAGHARITGDGSWQSGHKLMKGEIDGPMAFNLAINVRPMPPEKVLAPLDMIRAPVDLKIALAGDLPKINARLDLACANIQELGHALLDTDLSVTAKDLTMPLDASALRELENENSLHVSLKSMLDKEPVSFDSDVFLQALRGIPALAPVDGAEKQAPGEEYANGGWRVGLRDLRLNAFGVTGSGDVAALLANGEKPALDGGIELSVRDWRAISAFIPDQKLSGAVDIGLRLVSGQDNAPDKPVNASLAVRTLKAGTPQNLRVAVEIPSFSMLSTQNSQGVSLRDLSLKAGLADVFQKPVLDCNLAAPSISVAGLRLGAKIKADGPIDGPLSVDVSSSGDVASHIAVQWEPGKAILKTLDARANLAKFMGGQGKGGVVGLVSSQRAEIGYGDEGISARGLDVRIIPSGRLIANGSLGRDRLDFNLKLENLEFKPWQALVPQIPAGSASIQASLRGTPNRPGGDFSLAVNKLAIPGGVVPPVSLALKGGVENRGSASFLTARLELDPSTLKALGGQRAAVSARVPLGFGVDGIPKPDMGGRLEARVRWNGALGPLWNLLPIPDRRLNGRLDINLDAGGTLGKPVITGGVNIANGRYEDLLLGVLLTDINVRLNLAEHGSVSKLEKGNVAGLPGGMTLTAGISDGRGGKISIDGKGSLDGRNLDVTATIDKLRPLRRRDIHVELSGKTTVRGSATAPVVNGEIIVDQGEVLLDNLEFTSSVTTLNITGTPAVKNRPQKNAKPATAAPAEAGAPDTAHPPAGEGSLNVRINMLPRFSVEGRGLTSMWKANLLIVGTPESPSITGKIEAVRGSFDFLGKIFMLTRGVVTFAGGSLANPLINMELTNEGPDLTAHILVTGPADKIRLTMTSDPVLPRDEILSRVLFGRSVSDLSRLEALQLAAAVAQLAGFGSSGSGIMGFAKKTLGVDVLRLGTSRTGAAGEPGDQTAGGTTVEMGKYINDMIYMGVQQGMHPDSTAFIIELELTPRTSLEMLSESNRTWGGLKWKMNY